MLATNWCISNFHFIILSVRPLFANSLLSIIQTLLDQSRENDMLIVGCEALFDFVNNQVGSLGLSSTLDWVVQTIGCYLLFIFMHQWYLINLQYLIPSWLYCFMQKDGTYMFHLDGFIPKLCQLAQQIGEEENAKHLRTVGLKALSAMVQSSCGFCLLFSLFTVCFWYKLWRQLFSVKYKRYKSSFFISSKRKISQNYIINKYRSQNVD